MSDREIPELYKPVRRRYEERSRHRRDVDSADSAFAMKQLTFGFIAAGYMSIPIALMVGLGVINLPVALGILGGTIVGVYLISGAFASGSAKVASKIYAPSGQSTPRRAEYSRAQSLFMRGQYRDAAVAYEVHCLEDPADPEPYFRIADIYRKHLQEPEEAIAWYRRASADARLTLGEELRIISAIVDTYVRDLRAPRKAIPELVQLTRRFPDTEAATAAQMQLESMRALLSDESEGLASFTTQFLEKIDRGALMQAATRSREDMERDLIAEALIATDNNRAAAAARLGISETKLETAMRDLRM